MKFRSLFAVGVLVSSGFPVWSANAGSSGADILKMSTGARAIGMGEAYVAQADDISGLAWNPASLAFLSQSQASFSYNQYFQGLNYQQGAVGTPLENGGIGGSFSYLGYGPIDGYDTFGKPIGEQKANTLLGTLGGAWLSDYGSLGFSAKGLQEDLAGDNAHTVAFDVGGTWVKQQPIIGDGTLRIGAVVQNMGPGIKFIQQTDPLPWGWKIGAAGVQLWKKLNVSLDIGKPRDTGVTEQGGFEYWLVPMLALRAGYAHDQFEGSGARAGIGLRLGSLSFDYAYAGYGALGLVHRYELTFRFGQIEQRLNAEERAILHRAKVAMSKGQYETATLLFNSLVEMEPNYSPARRYIRVAMGRLEEQQHNMAQRWQPYAPRGKEQESPADTDDIEAILNMDTPKAAQAPTPPGQPEPPPVNPATLIPSGSNR